MSGGIYQQLYNQQREWDGSVNQQQRKNFFKHARKERRTRTYDQFRGDIAMLQQEELRPVPKYTFRDTISKLLRERKIKPVTKPRPFVVGTVRHKIHSPPFLHEALGSDKTQKKKLTPMQIRSFAPCNYKFKPPKGLETNLATPSAELNDISPFILNTVWNRLANKNSREKNFANENVTVRSRKKKYAHDSPDSIFSAGSSVDVGADAQQQQQKTAKKELWPEELSQELVFGRLNLARKEKSLNNLLQDDEKEGRHFPDLQLNNSVSGASPNNKYQEPEEEQSENLEEVVDTNLMLTSATIPYRNTSKQPEQLEIQSLDSNEKTKSTDFRISQISPPKTFLSTTILNFDDSKICMDRINVETVLSSSSTPSVQGFFKTIREQVEDLSDLFSEEEETVEIVLPNRNTTVRDISSTNNTVQESPIEDNLGIDNSHLVAGESPIAASGNTPKAMNSTFRKYPVVIEEDEENEELEESHVEDNINNSLNTSMFDPSNANKPNIDPENLNGMECDDILESKNISETKNNGGCNDRPSLSNGTLQDNCTDQTVSTNNKNTDSRAEIDECIINSSSSGLEHQSLNNSFTMSDGTPSVPKTNLQDNGTGQLDDEIKESTGHPRESTEKKTNKSFNSSFGFEPNQANSKPNKDTNLRRSKIPIRAPSLSKSTLQDNSSDQINSPIQEKSIDSLVSINEDVINSSSGLMSDQIDPDKDQSLNNSLAVPDETPSVSKPNLQDDCTRDSNNSIKKSTVHSRESRNRRMTNSFISSAVFVPIHTNRKLNKNNSLNNSSTTPVQAPSLPTSSLQDDCTEEPTDAIKDSTSHSGYSKRYKEIDEIFNSVSAFAPNQINLSLNEDKNPSKENVETDSKINAPSSSVEIVDNDCSRASDGVQQTVSSNSTSNKILENEPTEISDEGPCNLSSTQTSDGKTTQDNNEIADMNIHSCSKNSIDNAESANHPSESRGPSDCQVDIIDSSQVEKENDPATTTRHPPDSMDEKTDFDKIPHKIDTLPKVSLFPAIKVDLMTEFQITPVIKPASDEIADAGRVQAPAAVPKEILIDLTDSPGTPTRKSIKPNLRKSALDVKSPILLSNQKRNLKLPSSHENTVIDLISDDEDDYTVYLNSLLKKYDNKSSPRNRTPLASIGNIPRLSSCPTPQSPLANQVNSSAKKTPILAVETIAKVNVSAPAVPSEGLVGTPCKTPRKRNVVKEIAIAAEEVPSPLRVMSLRTRNISVSPSPQKGSSRRNTPRCTPVKRIVDKVALEVSEDPNQLGVVNLRIETAVASPSAKKCTLRKTPTKRNVLKEVSMEVCEDSNHLRVMNLRSRNINVSPSLKKMTPRRKKNENQCA